MEKELEQRESTERSFIEVKKALLDDKVYYSYKEMYPKKSDNLNNFRADYCTLNNVTLQEFNNAMLSGLDLLIRSRVNSKRKPDSMDYAKQLPTDADRLSFFREDRSLQDKKVSEWAKNKVFISTKGTKITAEEAASCRSLWSGVKDTLSTSLI